MIPKTIHYCWFGKKKIPNEYKKYIESWRKYCPDYEIIEWNEENYDVSRNEFLKLAYESRKYAFVSDYVRVDVINKFGGVYLDTDVELVKNLDEFLTYKAFAGFENVGHVAFGLGFGSEANNDILSEIMDFYRDIDKFKGEDGLFSTEWTCPRIQSQVLESHGMIRNGEFQVVDDFVLFPRTYFAPMLPNGKYDLLSDKTVSIHHYGASWIDGWEKIKYKYLSRIKYKLVCLMKR